MNSTLVILVVGLSPDLVGVHTPNLKRLSERGALRALDTVTPAVTCTAQSTLVTGLPPSGHGAVANGWYFRDTRRGPAVAPVQPAWSPARKSGTRPRRATRTSPAPRCSGGTTCMRPPIGARRRGPCIPPTGARSPITTPIPPSCTTNSTPSSVMFPLFKFWGPDGRHHLEPVDRARHAARHGDPQADADALLSAAPGLQPPAPRPDPSPPRDPG